MSERAPDRDTSQAAADDRLAAGTPAFRRANFAMFVGGFTTFALLYGTQPMLPLFSSAFDVSPARASLTVSAATGALALSLIPASVLADRVGRVPVMRSALALAALLSIAAAAVNDFNQLVVLRALLGIALAGLPAAAMAYLGEEVAPNAQGRAMGLYIAGNALGGMSGRILAASLSEWGSWRTALAVLGALGVIAAAIFWKRLPPSMHFRPRAAAPGRILRDARHLLADGGMPLLFLTAFLAMGAFVGLYNYLSFHLAEAPFRLGQSAIGAIFLLYLTGTWASAWAGLLADRHGRRNVLWIMVAVMLAGLALTLSSHLALVVCAVGIFTFGFFATHSLASGWVGQRAREQRALGAALYLSSYYLGSSVLGSLSGMAWSAGGWPAVVAVLGACVLATFAIARRLRRLAPQEAVPASRA